LLIWDFVIGDLIVRAQVFQNSQISNYLFTCFGW